MRGPNPVQLREPSLIEKERSATAQPRILLAVLVHVRREAIRRVRPAEQHGGASVKKEENANVRTALAHVTSESALTVALAAARARAEHCAA
jgi:hypothetical protein